MYDEKYELELELVKRNLELTKLKISVLDAELHYKKLEEAKPKDSGEGYITYNKEAVDYLMDVLGDFVTRFENLDVPTWSEQLAHALALLRKDSKVRVTDWEEYKFQWRNGRDEAL